MIKGCISLLSEDRVIFVINTQVKESAKSIQPFIHQEREDLKASFVEILRNILRDNDKGSHI